MSKVIGVGLSRQLGWKVDLKNPQVEVLSSFHFFLLLYFLLFSDFCLFLSTGEYPFDWRSLPNGDLAHQVFDLYLSSVTTMLASGGLLICEEEQCFSENDFRSPSIRLPLANRYYIKTTGLRSTIAWAIASLAQIQVSKHIACILLNY